MREHSIPTSFFFFNRTVVLIMRLGGGVAFSHFLAESVRSSETLGKAQTQAATCTLPSPVKIRHSAHLTVRSDFLPQPECRWFEHSFWLWLTCRKFFFPSYWFVGPIAHLA